MWLRSLIVIATTINYVACAAAPKHIKITEPMQVIAEAPPIKDEWLGIQEIDPNNPPRDGLWLNWEDAYAMAIYNRKQRVNYETAIINANKDREIMKSQLDMTRKQLADVNSPAKSWWLTWGFPIGLGIGVILGIVVPLTTQGVQNNAK